MESLLQTLRHEDAVRKLSDVHKLMGVPGARLSDRRIEAVVTALNAKVDGIGVHHVLEPHEMQELAASGIS